MFYLNSLKGYAKLFNEDIPNIIKDIDISNMIRMLQTNKKLR